MKESNIIQVSSPNPPIIEIDEEVNAVYIRFSNNKIIKTFDNSQDDYIATIDVDKDSNVVGVELIGVKNFSICIAKKILKKLQINNLPNFRGVQKILV